MIDFHSLLLASLVVIRTLRVFLVDANGVNPCHKLSEYYWSGASAPSACFGPITLTDLFAPVFATVPTISTDYSVCRMSLLDTIPFGKHKYWGRVNDG